MNITNTLAPHILHSLTKDLYNTSPLACRVKDIDSWEDLDEPIPTSLVEAIQTGNVRTDARWLDGPERWLVELLEVALVETKSHEVGYLRCSPSKFERVEQFEVEAARLRTFYGSEKKVLLDDLGNTSTEDVEARKDFAHLCEVASGIAWQAWAWERLRAAGIV